MVYSFALSDPLDPEDCIIRMIGSSDANIMINLKSAVLKKESFCWTKIIQLLALELQKENYVKLSQDLRSEAFTDTAAENLKAFQVYRLSKS